MLLKRALKPYNLPGHSGQYRNPPGLGLPASLAMLILIGLLPLLSYLWIEDSGLAEENGPIEWLQIVMLIGAAEAHGIHAWRLQRSGVEFVLSTSLAVLAIAFAMREIDVLAFGNSETFLAIESALQVLKIAVGLALLAFLASRMRQIIGSLPAILRQPVCWMSLAGGIILLIGIPFDDNALMLNAGLSRLIEELLELASYSLLFIASMTYRPA